jgi:glycosyltransferase involved in cell wall biosynthesis
MLGEAALRISVWKKRFFWWLAQRSALAYADCIHATGISEYGEIRAAGLKNPVAIVPNGVDLPDLADVSRPHSDDRQVLALGRIHPKKGLDRLVRAWAQVERDFPAWSLRIVGPAEVGHDNELRSIANNLDVKRVSIEGPVYSEAKLAAYRCADLFVLPTLNENFGMTVAESLAAGTPVISTKGAPWPGLGTERCGWWIDHGVEALASVLKAAMATPREDLEAMGARGRAWMARDFGWDRIARDMLDVYRWLRGGGEPPPMVHLG